MEKDKKNKKKEEHKKNGLWKIGGALAIIGGVAWKLISEGKK